MTNQNHEMHPAQLVAEGASHFVWIEKGKVQLVKIVHQPVVRRQCWAEDSCWADFLIERHRRAAI